MLGDNIDWAAWDPFSELFVVGYVDTPAGHRVLSRAAAEAADRLARVVVVRVAPIVYSVARSAGPFEPLNHPRLHPEQFRRAEPHFSGVVSDVEFVSMVGEPDRALVQVATTRKADLLIVGHGRPSWLNRSLRQDVSRNVSRRAQCAVLLVED